MVVNKTKLIMSLSSDNNMRIAKNTLLLYFRMLFMMSTSFVVC